MAPRRSSYKDFKELEFAEGDGIEGLFNAVEKYLAKKGRSDLLSPDQRRIILTLIDYSKKKPKTDFHVVHQFLTQAENDLTSAKLLHENEQYATSTYHLQQASEKIAKAWCLYYGYIKESDLTDISHKTPRAFLKAIRSQMGDLALQIIRLSNKNYNPEVNKLEKTINRMDDIARIEYDSIISMLEAGKTVELWLKKELSKYNFLAPKTILKDLSSNTMAFIWAYIISIITFPHEESTRYPNTKKRINALNPADYTIELGIVKAIPLIIPYLQTSIQSLYKLHDKYVAKGANLMSKER